MANGDTTIYRLDCVEEDMEKAKGKVNTIMSKELPDIQSGISQMREQLKWHGWLLAGIFLGILGNIIAILTRSSPIIGGI